MLNLWTLAYSWLPRVLNQFICCSRIRLTYLHVLRSGCECMDGWLLWRIYKRKLSWDGATGQAMGEPVRVRNLFDCYGYHCWSGILQQFTTGNPWSRGPKLRELSFFYAERNVIADLFFRATCPPTAHFCHYLGFHWTFLCAYWSTFSSLLVFQ